MVPITHSIYVIFGEADKGLYLVVSQFRKAQLLQRAFCLCTKHRCEVGVASPVLAAATHGEDICRHLNLIITPELLGL